MRPAPKAASGARTPFSKYRGKRIPEPLPGGLYVEICKRHQILPGPQATRAIELLRTKAERGELVSGQHWDYYLDALDDEGGLPSV